MSLVELISPNLTTTYRIHDKHDKDHSDDIDSKLLNARPNRPMYLQIASKPPITPYRGWQSDLVGRESEFTVPWYAWYSGAELKITKHDSKNEWKIVHVQSNALVDTKKSLVSAWKWVKERIQSDGYYPVANVELRFRWGDDKDAELTPESFAKEFVLESVRKAAANDCMAFP